MRAKTEAKIRKLHEITEDYLAICDTADAIAEELYVRGTFTDTIIALRELEADIELKVKYKEIKNTIKSL